MKKSDIAAQMADKLPLSRADTESAVGAVPGTITQALARGKSVRIAGFGVFSVKKRPPRQSHKPCTGESFEIAASTVPAFKAGKALRKAVA